MTTKKIDLNNFLFIIYNMYLSMGKDKYGIDEQQTKLKQMYIDRVLTDHSNNTRMQDKLLNLSENTVDFYIKTITENDLEKKTQQCCCFFK